VCSRGELDQREEYPALERLVRGLTVSLETGKNPLLQTFTPLFRRMSRISSK